MTTTPSPTPADHEARTVRGAGPVAPRAWLGPEVLEQDADVLEPDGDREPDPDHLLAPDPDFHREHGPALRTLRARRGVLWASIGTLIALVSHVAGGGSVPAWQGVALPWVVSAWLAVLLAGHAHSLLRLSLAVGGAQFAFHALFMFGSGAGGGHHHHGPAVMPAATSGPGGLSVHLGHSGTEMLLWHGVGAVATIALVHRWARTGRLLEAILRELAERLTRRPELPAGSGVVLAAPALPPHDRTLPAPAGCYPETFRRRGPPLTLAA